MEQTPLISHLRVQLNIEKQKYLQAVAEGKEFFEAKQILQTINKMQLEFDKALILQDENMQEDQITI